MKSKIKPTNQNKMKHFIWKSHNLWKKYDNQICMKINQLLNAIITNLKELDLNLIMRFFSKMLSNLGNANIKKEVK